MVSKLLPHEYEKLHRHHSRSTSDELRKGLADKMLRYPSVARQVLRERGETELPEKPE